MTLLAPHAEISRSAIFRRVIKVANGQHHTNDLANVQADELRVIARFRPLKASIVLSGRQRVVPVTINTRTELTVAKSAILTLVPAFETDHRRNLIPIFRIAISF